MPIEPPRNLRCEKITWSAPANRLPWRRARLAELLHLNPALGFDPIEPTVVPLELALNQGPADNLVAEALSARPELAEARHLVCEAIARWKREKYAPFVPSVLLGVSDGGMTAGKNSDYAAGQNRLDVDAVAYWELRNFGLGDQAARRDARSAFDQTHWRQIEVMDRISREVTEADVQVACSARANRQCRRRRKSRGAALTN